MSVGRPTDASQLGANGIFDFAFNLIIKKCENEIPGNLTTTVLTPAEGETIYGVRFAGNDKAVVLLSAACDKPSASGITNNLGTTPLPDVLRKIRKLQAENPNDSYAIPLAECNSVLGMFTRQHWTLLLIQNNECYFLDPNSAALMWPPSRISASSFYSLKPIQNFLAAAQFNLQTDNTIYLGWQEQSDTVNCGRYCAEIASRLTLKVLIGADNADSLKSNLSIPPHILKLIEQSSQCETHKLIMGIDTIVDIRKQPTLSRKLKFSELGEYGLRNAVVSEDGAEDFIDVEANGIDTTKIDFSKIDPAVLQKLNSELIARKKLDFFEKGEGGLKQLHRDFPCFNIMLQGKLYAEIFPNSDETSVSEAAKNSGLSEASLQNIIDAHSQGPASFVPFVLTHGIRTEGERKISITQPPKIKMQITHKGETTELSCEFAEIPIKSNESAKIIGHIEGPMKATFTLAQNENVWGWQLQTIEAKNPDVLRIMLGMMLSEEYILDIYCKTSNVAVFDSNKSQTEAINDFYLDVTTASTLKELRAKVADLEQQKIQLTQDLNGLNEKLVIMTDTKKATLLVQLKQKDKEIKALKDQHTVAEAKLEKADQILEKNALLNREFKAMQSRYVKLESDIKILQGKLAHETRLKTELQALLDAEKTTLTKQLQETSDSVKSLQQTLDQMETLINELKIQNVQLVTQLAQLTSQNEEKEMALASRLKELDQSTEEIAQLKQLSGLQNEIDSEMSQDLVTVQQELSQLEATNTQLLHSLQEKSAEAEALRVELSNKTARVAELEPLNAELSNQRNALVDELEAKLTNSEALREQLQQSNDEAIVQSEARLANAEEQFNLARTDLTSQLDALRAQNETLQIELANRPANVPEVVEFRVPREPVIAYATAGFVVGGLGITATMVATGLISLTLLAAIPVVGWAVAAGALLAFTIVLAVKSVMNAISNRASAQVQAAKDQAQDQHPVSISIKQLDDVEAAVSYSSRLTSYTPNQSALRSNSFLNQPNPAASLADLEVDAELDVSQNCPSV